MDTENRGCLQARPPIVMPPATPSWIDEELVRRTIRVWQPYYRGPLTPEDAVEILECRPTFRSDGPDGQRAGRLFVKRYLALARVSSREQEREGFSLDVQADALQRYAEKNRGEIVKLYRIAETASKKDERKAFREMLQYARQNAHQIDGILFYKVDRAARNLFDYVELERLESEHGIEFISVTQPTENTPAGKMQRRILANMASFYTEQQSLDVREGLARRVQNGLFVSKAPYGYRNVRIDGRGLIELHPENAGKIRRIFELYAYFNLTLDTLGERLVKEGILFKKSCPTFSRSTLYKILTDRAYIGEVKHQGVWYPGQHEPIIDRATWNRVQSILGGKTYRCHEMTYAGELVRCGHCGHPITGEVKTKKTKAGSSGVRVLQMLPVQLSTPPTYPPSRGGA